MKKQIWILALLLGISFLQILHYYPLLPERIASHFNGAGRPNGWSAKGGFLITYLGVLSSVVFTFLVIPIVIRKTPVRLINLPNKEYWLAPERRDQTFTLLARQMLWFGIATLAFFIGTFQLVIRANLSPEKGFSSSTMWVFLGTYLGFLTGWLIRLFLKFRIPRESARSPREGLVSLQR